jgi:hypothetical protein
LQVDHVKTSCRPLPAPGRQAGWTHKAVPCGGSGARRGSAESVGRRLGARRLAGDPISAARASRGCAPPSSGRSRGVPRGPLRAHPGWQKRDHLRYG